MSRRSIANFCAIPAALFLVVIGILHGVVNAAGFRRAIDRGEIAARLGDSVIVHVAFVGGAVSLLGVLVFSLLPGLRAGSRLAARLAGAVGILVGVLGMAGFIWKPESPSVLIFLFFGALLAVPLLVWRREFTSA